MLAASDESHLCRPKGERPTWFPCSSKQVETRHSFYAVGCYPTARAEKYAYSAAVLLVIRAVKRILSFVLCFIKSNY